MNDCTPWPVWTGTATAGILFTSGVLAPRRSISYCVPPLNFLCLEAEGAEWMKEFFSEEG